MKKIIGIILIIFFLISCNISKKTESKNDTEYENELTRTVFKKVETKNSLNLEYQLLDENNEQIKFASLNTLPEFPGGLDSLTVFIQTNFEIDQGNREEIEGKVKSTFIVDTLGKVVDIEIVESLRKDYDNASYKVISKIPDWKPAEMKNGRKVRVKFLLPFKFIMEE